MSIFKAGFMTGSSSGKSIYSSRSRSIDTLAVMGWEDRFFSTRTFTCPSSWVIVLMVGESVKFTIS